MKKPDFVDMLQAVGGDQIVVDKLYAGEFLDIHIKGELAINSKYAQTQFEKWMIKNKKEITSFLRLAP